MPPENLFGLSARKRSDHRQDLPYSVSGASYFLASARSFRADTSILTVIESCRGLGSSRSPNRLSSRLHALPLQVNHPDNFNLTLGSRLIQVLTIIRSKAAQTVLAFRAAAFVVFQLVRFLVNTLTGVLLKTSLVVFVVNESFGFELTKVIKIPFGYKLLFGTI